MKSMRWLRTIKGVLREEPETWLAYLHGQQFENLAHLKEAKPRFRGTLIRLAAFAYHLVCRSRFRQQPKHLGQHSILAYAGTANQRDSLDETLNALHRQGVSGVGVGGAGHHYD
ncbi:MAG: hypothetical protein U5L11_03495 [Arhodomonas sp.]|nr:hypothetical protein [Arhodomonas sp.]